MRFRGKIVIGFLMILHKSESSRLVLFCRRIQTKDACHYARTPLIL